MQDSVRVLLEACLRAASERDDVRRSLVTLNAWLSRELDRLGRDAKGRGHGVLTPASRGRDDRDAGRAAVVDAEKGPQKRIAEELSVVVTRARWKAAACRLSLDRCAVRRMDEGGERESTEAQISTRERSLRTRLSKLPDTSAWMLDQPFGIRASEPTAFDADEAVASKLERVADCYETLALAAETAIELDEAGIFRGGPPPSFLYLLAEAQSALLSSLAEAPTRSDSDQRDVFLWLKEQTTRYRIYVDRHMRLDDPADANGSKELTARIQRTARELTEERRARRQRGQLLNKIRYHVRKILDDGVPRESEVESLAQAVERWKEAGFGATERALIELLEPLREHAAATSGKPSEDLQKLVGDVLPEEAHRGGGRDGRSGRGEPAGDGKDPKRTAEILEEVRGLLAERRVVLLAADVTEEQRGELATELGAREVSAVHVDVDGDAAERWSTLDECLEDETVDLFLLGVRMGTDEYQRFKERCLERKTPFVRLPGSFAPSAVAHQITRQVGWRLRAQRDPSVG